MRKLLISMLLILVLFSSSCSFVKKYPAVLARPGVFIEVNIQYKKGKIINEFFQKVTWYDALTANTLEEAQADIEPLRQVLLDLEGIDYSIVFEENSYTEKIIVYYDRASEEDLKLLAAIVPFGQDLEYDDFDKTLEVMEEQGFRKRT